MILDHKMTQICQMLSNINPGKQTIRFLFQISHT